MELGSNNITRLKSWLEFNLDKYENVKYIKNIKCGCLMFIEFEDYKTKKKKQFEHVRWLFDIFRTKLN